MDKAQVAERSKTKSNSEGSGPAASDVSNVAGDKQVSVKPNKTAAFCGSIICALTSFCLYLIFSLILRGVHVWLDTYYALNCMIVASDMPSFLFDRCL